MEFATIFNFAKDLLVFFLSLSVLVLIHEFGHFIMARRAGIKVEEFGLGFPPRVWGKKFGETIYSLNAIPIGGFVRLYGEDETVDTDVDRAYSHKGKLVRASILVAGVLMNFLLGVLIFSIIAWSIGVPKPSGQIKVTGVEQGSPADQAGIKEGDIIIAVDGESVHEGDQFRKIIAEDKGREVTLTITHDMKSNVNVQATPRVDITQNQGALGVAFTDKELTYPAAPERFVYSIKEGFSQALFWIQVTVGGLRDAVLTAFHGQKPEGLAGPIGIFQITGVAAKQGVFTLLSFIGVLSVNLAVLNIMPFPALDGGRLLFVIVEALFGKTVLATYERHAHLIGMIILLSFMALLSFGELLKLIQGIPIIPQ